MARREQRSHRQVRQHREPLRRIHHQALWRRVSHLTAQQRSPEQARRAASNAAAADRAAAYEPGVRQGDCAKSWRLPITINHYFDAAQALGAREGIPQAPSKLQRFARRALAMFRHADRPICSPCCRKRRRRAGVRSISRLSSMELGQNAFVPCRPPRSSRTQHLDDPRSTPSSSMRCSMRDRTPQRRESQHRPAAPAAAPAGRARREPPAAVPGHLISIDEFLRIDLRVAEGARRAS